MTTQPQGSLHYRRNAPEIWNGQVPDKYLRLLPYISGQHILELGAAEGVLSLLLADRDPSARVIAVEANPHRHAEALKLQARWRALGRHVDGCTMVCADLRERLDLLDGVDTFVAIRAIYYLREAIPDVFKAVGAQATSVVLSGNANRARWPDSTPGAAELGEWNRYAGIPAMSDVITAAGFTVGTVVTEGDPIVTGQRERSIEPVVEQTAEPVAEQTTFVEQPAAERLAEPDPPADLSGPIERRSRSRRFGRRAQAADRSDGQVPID